MAPLSSSLFLPTKTYSVRPRNNVNSDTTPPSKLELCTEILCSENGVIYPLEEEDFSDLHTLEDEKLTSRRRTRKNATNSRSEFPPPLTTLTGEARIRLQTKREEGRLVLVPFVPEVLEAERHEGRLRMRILPRGPHHGYGRKEVKAASRCKEEDELTRRILVSDAMWVSS